MTKDIDDVLVENFNEDRINQLFYRLKYSKWNRFSDIDDPEINIAMGADGVTFEAFEIQLERQARNICSRVHNDKYIFYPFRELDIEKEPAQNGQPPKYRILSIASIRDNLVQSLLYEDVLYEPLEELFKILDKAKPVSFAYRKGKSAPKAALEVNSYIQSGYNFVLDADLSKYFDTIPHHRLLARLETVLGGSHTKAYKLVYRFVHTDRVEFSTYKYARRKNKNIRHKIFHWKKPLRKKRAAGVPQGGVLSGMLANLYLHDFDNWVVNDLGQRIDLKYVRYADDFIILARSEDLLKLIENEVGYQISSLGLSINKDKTEKKDIKVSGLDFVGFHFDGTKLSWTLSIQHLSN